MLGLSSQAQNSFTGRNYLGEGSPYRWFRLETDSTGTYYAKGDVGYSELDSVPLTWQQIGPSAIRVIVHYSGDPALFDFTEHPERKYLLEADGLEVFHLMRGEGLKE